MPQGLAITTESRRKGQNLAGAHCLHKTKNKTNQRNPNLISVKSKPKGTAQTRFKGIFLLKLNMIHIITEVTVLPPLFD
jgi:hypothetical protein